MSSRTPKCSLVSEPIREACALCEAEQKCLINVSRGACRTSCGMVLKYFSDGVLSRDARVQCQSPRLPTAKRGAAGNLRYHHARSLARTSVLTLERTDKSVPGTCREGS